MQKNGKEILMNTLNGLSTGIIVALVPGALLNNLIKALLPKFPNLAIILTMTSLAAMMLPVASAACVGMIGKLSPIQTASLALAAVCGAGNFHFTKQGFNAAGSGDVINIAVTIMIGYLLIELLGTKFKAYTVLLLPTLVLIVAGGLGILTLKPVQQITTFIGMIIAHLTNLQPILTGALMGIAFALLIVSPISSVGIATAVGIHGIAAGSANLGITAASFALAIYGWKANSIGTSLAHFLGSPKMQMANLMTRPRLLLPIIINAAIMGGVGALFKIGGTPTSAGFGFSGLIGPLAALNSWQSNSIGQIIEVTILFCVLPILLGFASNYLFNNRLNYFSVQDFALNYE
ncbi:PTS sugar transporter subunit IIC [Bombilactobacillus bombi]|uniref:PTS sugar transporter subunit IIC n=1 Tax=Bombilactobacillus bombi TaxID=1303590 RepID=UPI000E584492|nr:PTS sugar transporter subunit IIC [Bombilactobacillus bombi]AXX64709.1 PTS sugar transporter subunit IIC [Bombilactobacillus bombi]